MKCARGSVLWVKAGNVRRSARAYDRLLWDSKSKGQYVKEKHGPLK